MGMVTRCPSCATSFRLTPQQLQAHRGSVRCGRCATVFNAFDSLTTLPDAPEPRSEPEPIPTPEEAEVPRLAEETEAAEPAPQPVPVEPSPAAPPAPAVEEAAREPEAATPGSPPGPVLPKEFDYVAPAPRAQRTAAAWTAGAWALSVLLAGQILFLFRSEIAAALPRARPALEGACAAFGCTVPLPRAVEQWSIDASDLQAEPTRPSLMTLSATLRNRSSLTQAYPALELTLTDAADQPLARRMLAPADYLPKGTDPRAGLGGNSDLQLRLTLETGDLNAAGYRLFLFYP